jgi:hypothetical protein
MGTCRRCEIAASVEDQTAATGSDFELVSDFGLRLADFPRDAYRHACISRQTVYNPRMGRLGKVRHPGFALHIQYAH